mgnify:CR=1 FL=1
MSIVAHKKVSGSSKKDVLLAVKKVVELAHILGAAVLAGELSLISSLAEGTLARAHQKLGRRE